MEKRSLTFLSLFGLMVILSLACQPGKAAQQMPKKIHSAFVLYGQAADLSAQAMVRVIVDGATVSCPTLKSGSKTLSMVARINPDPVNFPVTVCEALYPERRAYSVTDTTHTITLPIVDSGKTISNVVVLGDTGCKSTQCKQPSAWPFAQLAAEATSVNGQTPDLILHMGDYNYSGTPGTVDIQSSSGASRSVQVYDAGDNTTQGMCVIPAGYYGQNSRGSQFPDSWLHWQNDFFKPAAQLLPAAAWIFARGNHELCSRAGPGWFYFLDASSVLLGQYHQQLSCPAAENPQPLVFTAPYLLDLPGLNVAVLDSTNACDSGLLNVEAYRNQMNVVRGLIDSVSDQDPVWLQTHRPFWGVDALDNGSACGPDGSGEYCLVTQTLQQAYNNKPLPASVQMVVSGHMHRFQALSFPSGHPQQLVVGNGGVQLSQTLFNQETQLTISGQKAKVLGLSEHGYMWLSKQRKNGWLGKLIGVQKTLLMSCLLNTDLSCKRH